MAQKFTLLQYLLLLPIKNNSSKITATTTITTRPRKATTNLIESTFHYTANPLSTTLSAAAATAATTLYLLTMGSCFGSLLTKEPTTSSTFLWRQATDEQDAELMADEETNSRKEKLIFRIIKFKRKQKHKQFIDKFWEHRNSNYSQLSTRNGNESISDIQLQNLDVNTLLNSSTMAKESVINAAIGPSHVCSRTSSSLDLEWEHEYGSHMRSYPLNLPAPPSAPASTQHNPPSLSESWHFLSQRHYFDDDHSNSFSSQHYNSMTPTAPETEPETSIAEPDQLNRRRYVVQTKLSTRTAQQQPQQQQQQQQNTRTSSRTSCSHISTPESLEWDIDEDQQRQMRVEDDNLGLETLELLHQIEQLKNKVLHETGDGLLDRRDDIDMFSNGGGGGGGSSGEYREEINIS